jgi:hypothetical protein
MKEGYKRLQVDIPADLHAALIVEAALRGLKLTSLVISLARAATDKEEP